MNPNALAALLAQFQQQQPGQWPPQSPPISPSSQPQADPISQLGQGTPQQFAFNLPGAAPTSPLQQSISSAAALQPKSPAPTAPGAAQGAMTWFEKMQPWLAAIQFVGSQSDQPVTFGGGRGGGYSTGSESLL